MIMMHRYASSLPREWKPTRHTQSGTPPMHTRFLNHSTNVSVCVACLHGTRLVLPIKVPSMPTTKHENHHPSIDRDVEIRARKLRLRMIVALCNFSVLIILLGIFWLYIRAIPSSMPFPMRWICIVCLYLETIAKNAWLIQIIDAIGRKHMSKLEDENRSRNRDLMTRTADLEDWILATCCVIAGLSTTGFVAWYWTEVIKLTAQSVFYWTCTMAGLCLLFWLFECAIKFYRKTKGLQHEDAWGLLICVNVLEFYNKFEAYGVLGRFADAVCLLLELPKALFYIMGFYIGRGSLFGKFEAKVPQDDDLTHHRSFTR